jgi:hypothetical protein
MPTGGGMGQVRPDFADRLTVGNVSADDDRMTGFVRRALLAMLGLALLTACGGGGDAEASDVPTSPDDRPMRDAMVSCIEFWMDEAAATPLVDVATESELADASKVLLEDCGNQRISDFNIGSDYYCNTRGCYRLAGNGYHWTTVAADWACEERPDLCEAFVE